MLGIEPARNIAQGRARSAGSRRSSSSSGADAGRQLAAEGKRADVLHANNVLAHVADLNGFVAGIRAILKPTTASR